MKRPHVATCVVFVAASFLGCEGTRVLKEVPIPQDREVYVRAATAPDTVEAGAPFVLKLRYIEYVGATLVDSVPVAVDDSTYEIHAHAIEPGGGRTDWLETRCTIAHAPSRPFSIRIVGAGRTLVLPVAVGTPTVQQIRFAVTVIDQWGVPFKGLPIVLWRRVAASRDTIAEATTDRFGVGQAIVGCGAPLDTSEYVVSSPYVYLDVPLGPAACGIAERTILPYEIYPAPPVETRHNTRSITAPSP